MQPRVTNPPNNAIYRYEIPADGEWHNVDLSGDIVHVASRRSDVVEFWAWHGTTPARTRQMRVYGTGREITEPVIYVGTALDGPMVWHLVRRPGYTTP